MIRSGSLYFSTRQLSLEPASTRRMIGSWIARSIISSRAWSCVESNFELSNCLISLCDDEQTGEPCVFQKFVAKFPQRFCFRFGGRDWSWREALYHRRLVVTTQTADFLRDGYWTETTFRRPPVQEGLDVCPNPV